MEEKELKQLFSITDKKPARGWTCPDENQLAEFVEGRVDDRTRKSLEAHFADCDFCLASITLLTKSSEWPPPEEVPAHLLVRARSLVDTRKKKTFWRWGWAAATACLLVFGAFMFWQFHPNRTLQSPGDFVAQVQQSQPTETPKRDEPPVEIVQSKPTAKPSEKRPTLRSSNNELKPAVLSPREGAVLSNSELNVRWTPVAGASFYEVKVVSNDGGLVFRERTSQPALVKSLQPGAKYFVTVIAYFDGGRTVMSDLISFRVVGK